VKGAAHPQRCEKLLIAIILVIAAVLASAFAVQYYLWTVSYKVAPYSYAVSVAVPDTQGATKATNVLVADLKDGTTFEIDPVKDVIPHFVLKAAEAPTTAFDDLTLYIKIYSYNATVAAWTLVDTVTLAYITDGVASDLDVAGAVTLTGGTDYEVEIYADYNTQAVTSTVTGSFYIYVYAVEA